MRCAIICFFGVLSLTMAVDAGADWSDFSSPTSGSTISIGKYSAGCLQGAQALPLHGEGYQTIRVSRNRYYGHPELLRFITRLGAAVRREALGVMLVGDLSMPRGGPFDSGHRSHQTGLDVDIPLRLDLPHLSLNEREDVEPLSMVDAERFTINRQRWTPQQARLIELAAKDPTVARIFIHPAIKRELCRSAVKDRRWLRKVRPWFGHMAHLHARLRCPDRGGDCVEQSPPPPGDGCGSELSSWFPDPKSKPQPSQSPKRPKPKPILPAQCQAMLSETG